mmetsp:Transcript_42581/g.85458  ORF Transcript_42581/g.85458 Transcript_42581/m.85458 type:complete len:305 (-) Transcript_42581:308-1222(-)
MCLASEGGSYAVLFEMSTVAQLAFHTVRGEHYGNDRRNIVTIVHLEKWLDDEPSIDVLPLKTNLARESMRRKSVRELRPTPDVMTPKPRPAAQLRTEHDDRVRRSLQMAAAKAKLLADSRRIWAQQAWGASGASGAPPPSAGAKQAFVQGLVQLPRLQHLETPMPLPSPPPLAVRVASRQGDLVRLSQSYASVYGAQLPSMQSSHASLKVDASGPLVSASSTSSIGRSSSRASARHWTASQTRRLPPGHSMPSLRSISTSSLGSHAERFCMGGHAERFYETHGRRTLGFEFSPLVQTIPGSMVL